MKTIRYTLLVILTCLVAQCGSSSFDAAYTDPKTGATFRGGVDIPRATSDNKSTVNKGP